MASKKAKPVLYRRKRELKTDYKKRLRLLMSKKLRVVLRFSNQKITAQIVGFEVKGDKVHIATSSQNLLKSGWLYSSKNFPASYLTGLNLAKLAREKISDKELILDTGFRTPLKKGKIYAFLKGAIDGGLNVKHRESEDIFPSEEKISGKDIQDYASSLKEKSPEEFQKKFALCLKNSADPTKMSENFEKIKVTLMG